MKGSLALSAFVHGGHGHQEWRGSPLHYLLEPEHLSATLLALAALLIARSLIHRRLQRRTSRR